MGGLIGYELPCDVAGPFDWGTSMSVSSSNEVNDSSFNEH